jgi:hypothetical protein
MTQSGHEQRLAFGAAQPQFPFLDLLYIPAPILGAATAGVVSRWQHDVPDAS